MKQLFCYVYKFWLSKFVDSKDDFLVRIIDKLFASKCSYCTNYRILFFGFGSGLSLVGTWVTWLGLILAIGSLLMTLGERHWLCEVKKHE